MSVFHRCHTYTSTHTRTHARCQWYSGSASLFIHAYTDGGKMSYICPTEGHRHETPMLLFSCPARSTVDVVLRIFHRIASFFDDVDFPIQNTIAKCVEIKAKAGVADEVQCSLLVDHQCVCVYDVQLHTTDRKSRANEILRNFVCVVIFNVDVSDTRTQLPAPDACPRIFISEILYENMFSFLLLVTCVSAFVGYFYTFRFTKQYRK